MQHTSFPLSASAVAVLLSLSHLPAWAEDEVLSTIVVSGSRSATELHETPVSIGAVSRTEWDRDRAKSVGEIINRIPGVFWGDLGNEQHTMGIRQPFNTQAMYQYLEDGIPLRPLGVFNHNALNETNVNSYDGVEVVKGAASSLYGSNAVGGAVNFLSQRPSRSPTAFLGARVDGTEGYTRLDSGASNTWGDLGLRFSHYTSHRDSRNWQPYSGSSKDALTLRGDYRLGPSSWLRASLVHTDLFAEMTGALTEGQYLNDPRQSANTFTWRKDKATRAHLAWEGTTTPQGLTTVTLFARDNDHGQLPSYTITACAVGVACPTGVRGTRNNNHVHSLGLDVKHEEALDWLRAKWVSGMYIDRSQNDYVSDNLSVTQVNGVNVGYVQNNAANPRGRRDYGTAIANDALFSQFEFSPAPAWRLVAGGRYDSIRYGFNNHLTPGANFGAPDEQRRFSRFSPKLGATWALGPNRSLYANWSQGFTPPEVSQLYGKSAIPDLRPSVFVNTEVGARAQWATGLRLDAALYRLGGRDTIVNYALASGNSENRNVGRTRSQGAELSLQQTVGALDWRAGVSLGRHRYLSYQASPSVDYSGRDMPSAPHHILNAQWGWTWAPGARVALGLVHLGGYWRDDANTERYPGHTLLNLMASQRWEGGWELWGQVRNLSNRHYAHNVTSNGYTPGAPRSLLVGLSKAWDAR